MLTEKQCPFTGPYGLPESGLKSKGPTCVALKRAVSRLGFLRWGGFDDHFNQNLSNALNKWDPGHTGYGKGRWEKLRAARVPAGATHAGEWALDAVALDLIRAEHSRTTQPPFTPIVYPVPQGEMGSVCQSLHQTAGLDGNWAIDICCPPNTTIVAVEAGTITKLSGRAPSQDLWDTQGVFGWSIHFRTDAGYRYFLTHLGVRLPSLYPGLRVAAGDTFGKVGDQRFRPDHVHYGVSSPAGSADAKQRILAVAAAPRID